MSVPLVLVVEDSDTNLAIVRGFLEDGGARVLEAQTGADGTALALEHRPDVIVLDVMLPDADGIQLCRRWRRDPRLEQIPVLLISGERLEDEDRASGLDSGALGYLAKPFSDAELVAQVKLLDRLGRTHRRMAEQNRQLERSFRELDQFARIVSHDLKEPLRTVTKQCRLLQEQSEGRLDPELAALVEQGRFFGARRMDRLIDDLLAYCRAGQEMPPLEPVDLNEVLARVIEHLDAAIEEGGAVVEVQSLPQIRGSRRMMVQLFQNLLGNALKFRGDAQPVITVDARAGGKTCEIRVRDNGVGIPPRDHDRIFSVFEQLDADDDRPGTGIGLAICKKIVECHGGRIWVESEPKRGTTFHVQFNTAGPG